MFDIQSVHESVSVKDAIEALVKDENAQIISGGTDVLIRVREGRDAGCSLVSVKNLDAIKGVKLLENGDIWIGSGSSFSFITNNEIIKKYIPHLGEATDTVGGPQIRNMGTIGGNICNGATSADSASTMWALEADIILEGPNGKRIVPINEFYTGPGRTVRERCELCTGFLIHPESYVNWFGKYNKYGKRRAMEIATMGCSVRVKLTEDKKNIEEARIAYGVAGPTPIRCHEAEAFIKGKSTTCEKAIHEFADIALSETNPRDSWRASKVFRKQIIHELAMRGLRESILRAGGEIAEGAVAGGKVHA